MFNTQKTGHDVLIRGMVKLQQSHPFFSYILMNFKMTAAADETIQTAAVNKYGNFFYNEDFILGLTEQQVLGTLVHETLHIAKEDFFRCGSRDLMLWNIASDCIINYIVKHEENLDLPACTLLPDAKGDITLGGKVYNVIGKCTEEIYDELFENADKIEIPAIGHGGFDQHLEGDEDGQGGKTGEEGECSSCPATASSSAEHKWKKVIIEAATNARARGTLPGSMESVVDALLNPVIDWRKRIQKFITNEIPVDYSNRRPGRRFYGTGVWAPSVLRENLEVFVGVDVSGSTLPDREYFMSEVSGILSAYEQIKARLIFWDASVNPKNDYEITSANKDKLQEMVIHDCNGGTQLSCYTQYCEDKNYSCRLHIILTDGYIESNPNMPNGNIIFVLSKDGSDEILKDHGAVCKLTDIE
jgi:predicted metal-dependent peptidase